LKVAGHISSNKLAGQLVRRRTGSLARSITGTGLRIDGVPAMRVGVFRGPSSRYAGLLEHGTKPHNPESPYDTVRPIPPRKALAMPVNDSLTAAGVARYPGPRQDPRELRFVPFRKSGISQGAIGGLYEEKQLKAAGDDLSKAKAAYLLLAKADYKPRHYLRSGLRDQLPQIALELGQLLGRLAGGRK